jgi:hypothetical protein
LSTKFIRSDEAQSYFVADTKGFSAFAITIDVVAVPDTLPPSSDLRIKWLDNKLTKPNPSLPIIIIGAAFLIFSFVMLKPKNKSPIFEKDDHAPLREYVKKLRQKGLTEDEVRKDLANAGWSDEVAESVLKTK